jgi:hypothetical protein
MTRKSVSFSNGFRPVNTSKNMQPNAYTSAAGVSSFPSICSGAA